MLMEEEKTTNSSGETVGITTTHTHIELDLMSGKIVVDLNPNYITNLLLNAGQLKYAYSQTLKDKTTFPWRASQVTT